MEFRTVPPDCPGAVVAMREYFAEISEAFGFTAGTAVEDAVVAFSPPSGLFVLAGEDAAPAACGAVQFLSSSRAEVKRMWVAPDCRGRGVATRLLAHLESLVAEAGCREVVLDTNSALEPAISLYLARGYRPVEAYNDNPDADWWFAKQLD